MTSSAPTKRPLAADPLTAIALLLRVRPEIQEICRFAARWEAEHQVIKTFTLRGVKNQPPYLHDGRLLTLDDAVEFFNLVLGTKLTGRPRSPPTPA
jgi:cytochrome c peroxidase